MEDEEEATIPMFDVPKRYQPRKAAPNGATKWGKYGGPRNTCEMCVLDIRDGQLHKPMATATVTLTRETRRWLICKPHASLIKTGKRDMPM